MRQKIKILLADDDPVLRRLLPSQISSDDFEFSTAESAKTVLSKLKEDDFDIVLLDVNLPDISGIEILPAIRQTENAPEVIMLTADKSLQTGIEAMRRGAIDYITKPANPEEVETFIRKAVEKRRLVLENQRFRVVVRQQTQNLVVEPVHQSPLMKQIFSQAEKVAKIDTTLLITGESGTGKDVLARWVHSHSARADSPLISVNCGALPENLFESEFFGYERGSFTGATTQKIGLIEAADGSTLFLDEIGEMPLTMQVKLLHFLENGNFRRVGATRDRQSDVRVIAATNKNLPDEVREKRFRTDLYYRLNVIAFYMPPLRERLEDLSALMDFFLEKLRVQFNRPRLELSETAKRQIKNHAWQGNIRELRNTLERTAALSPNDFIEEIYGLENQNFTPASQTVLPDSPPVTIAELEKRHILQILKDVGGHREKAAVILGITSRTLYRKLNEYDIETDKMS
jgi:two-component system, NtrC family, response regulator AtoC